MLSQIFSDKTVAGGKTFTFFWSLPQLPHCGTVILTYIKTMYKIIINNQYYLSNLSSFIMDSYSSCKCWEIMNFANLSCPTRYEPETSCWKIA
jgi:hypothetical protein